MKEDFLFIIALQIIGIGFHVVQKAIDIDKRSASDGVMDVIKVFLQEDKFTLVLSFLILCLNLIGHYLVYTRSDIPKTFAYWDLIAFAAALFLGYAGQRIIYRLLGKAESVINKRIDEKLN